MKETAVAGREPTLPSTKWYSAASSGEALSASAWGPYRHFYPWEPSWDQRGSDPLCPPAWHSLHRVWLSRAPSGMGGLGCCDANVAFRSASLDGSQIYWGKTRSLVLSVGSQESIIVASQSWLLCTDRTIPSILSQYNCLLLLCEAHHGVNTLHKNKWNYF